MSHQPTRTRRIVSLYDLMKPILVGTVDRLVTDLARASDKGHVSLSDEQSEEYMRRLIRKLLTACATYELPCSAESVKSLSILVDNPHGSRPEELRRLTTELEGRVIDEIIAREFFY